MATATWPLLMLASVTIFVIIENGDGNLAVAYASERYDV